MESVVVVQGPTNCELVKKIKDGWADTPIIFSTWEDNQKDCYSESDIVIYNEVPKSIGTQNINLQKVSSLNGFIKAKELGYKRVIKWRSDFIPKNPYDLLKLFKKDFINFYSFINHRNGYVADFFMEGDVDDMINLFSFENIHPSYAEEAITNRMFELGLDKKANFICKELSNDGADVFWNKMGYWFSDNVVQEQYMDVIKNGK